MVRMHEQFKWQDWCESVELRYEMHPLRPVLWNARPDLRSALRRPYVAVKRHMFARALARLADRVPPRLSNRDLLEAKRAALRQAVRDINERYA
jgi:hypothetical protein